MEVMKKDNQLQILAWKTWDLHGRINEKIIQNGFSLCSHCSNNGRYCVISKSFMEEKERMVAIRDSLKDVHHILIYLQRVIKSSQKGERDEALASLQESMKLLTEMTNQCSDKEKKIDVVEELINFIGDAKGKLFAWDTKESKMHGERKKNVNWISRFLVSTTRFAFEFLVMFASIYSTVQFCQSRQQIQFNNSSVTEKNELLLNDSNSNIVHLDVLCGRG